MGGFSSSVVVGVLVGLGAGVGVSAGVALGVGVAVGSSVACGKRKSSGMSTRTLEADGDGRASVSPIVKASPTPTGARGEAGAAVVAAGVVGAVSPNAALIFFASLP